MRMTARRVSTQQLVRVVAVGSLLLLVWTTQALAVPTAMPCAMRCNGAGCACPQGVCPTGTGGPCYNNTETGKCGPLYDGYCKNSCPQGPPCGCCGDCNGTGGIGTQCLRPEFSGGPYPCWEYAWDPIQERYEWSINRRCCDKAGDLETLGHCGVSLPGFPGMPGCFP